MSQFTTFSHGLDLADVMVNSDLLHKACAAICKTTSNSDNDELPFSVSIQVSQIEELNNGKIIAFIPSTTCTAQILQEEGKDLVPSSGTFFDFIATKVNPCISINKTALQVFASLYEDLLSVLQDQIDITKLLIITGNALGGSIATLFTLWLLDTIYSRTYSRFGKPICITFGSPLLGDYHFQQAISERPLWLSCFLHVVLNQDPIPKLFTSFLLSDPLAAEPTTPTTYKPFGSFLFCSAESGCAFFDDPEPVFERIMSSESARNIDFDGLQINYYGFVLDCLRKKAICRGVSMLGEVVVSPLEVGLTLELEAIGVIKTKQQQPSNEQKTLIKKVPRGIHDAKKKFNETRISMTYLECYGKVTISERGYYDGFRKAGSKFEKIRRGKIVKHLVILSQYFKNMVKAAEQMPQKEAAYFTMRWLYGATNYRRMVEPLEIANYYVQGKRDYINLARPEHYKLLEKWFDDERTTWQTNHANVRSIAVTLTKDSCFWARVEEAIISCRVLNDGESSSTEDKELSKKSLIEFEDYVMGLVRNYSVSSDIFLPNTTFMDWWKEYEGIMGNSYNSCLTDFMGNSYQGYA